MEDNAININNHSPYLYPEKKAEEKRGQEIGEDNQEYFLSCCVPLTKKSSSMSFSPKLILLISAAVVGVVVHGRDPTDDHYGYGDCGVEKSCWGTPEGCEETGEEPKIKFTGKKNI